MFAVLFWGSIQVAVANPDAEIENGSFELGGSELDGWTNISGSGECKRTDIPAPTTGGTYSLELKDRATCETNLVRMTTNQLSFWQAGEDNDAPMGRVRVTDFSTQAIYAEIEFQTIPSSSSGWREEQLDTSSACTNDVRIRAINFEAPPNDKDWLLDLITLDYDQPCAEYDDVDSDGQCPFGIASGVGGNCARPDDIQSATEQDCDDNDNTVYPHSIRNHQTPPSTTGIPDCWPPSHARNLS